MKFFLASRINTPESILKLENFLSSDLSNKNVVYIPTAANAEEGRWSWKKSETLKMAKQKCKSVKVIELEDCRTKDILSDIRKADILWMAGGYPGYLLYWIRLSQLDKQLPQILKKGVIYVGSSAGSMLLSKTQYSAEMFDDAEYGASLIPGLGYLDFEIRPHYTDDMYEDVKEKWQKLGKGELCLLKDGEAITLVDGKIEFLGEKRMISAKM